MSKEFKCEREIQLPTSPEQVWAAIATTEGLAGWLFPMPIPALGEGAVIWDPPLHFAVRMERGEWFNALEYKIEGSRSSSTLRYVHHGIFMDNWDTQYDAVQQHTDFYLHTLGQYLEFFPGQIANFVGDVPGGIQGPVRSADADGFDQLRRALGIDPGVEVDTSVVMQRPGDGSIEGVVDYATPNFLGVRTSSALYRFFGRNAFGQPVGMAIHQFGESVDSDSSASLWQGWMETELN